MNERLIRKATPEDLEQIYMMGSDVWSDGDSKKNYLQGCRSSSKYAKGTWYVLAESNTLLSSLITYSIGPNQLGIGSIATPLELRKLGYASELIKGVIIKLDKEFNYPTYFLYADIAPEFYTRFLFEPLEQKFQKYQSSVCMIKQGNSKNLLSEDTIPKYF